MFSTFQGTSIHPSCIHKLFEAQVYKTPNAIAATFECQELDYKTLNQRANQLARYLQKLGVGPEVLVGICVKRSLDMVVGLLGILKAGGAYVPLDPTYPKERLGFILADAQVQVLISQTKLLDFLPHHQAYLVCLDRETEHISHHSGDNLNPITTESNLAYAIYTSGSTGKPKGVAIEHRNTVALLKWAQSVFSTEELAGVLASTSICFDLSVFELFLPLISGGRVILAENALHLARLPAAQEVTLINTVPSVMVELLAMGAVPAAVQTVNLAGEALHKDLVRRIYQLDHVRRVFNLYGPSEDTTYSTFALVSPDTERVTIGRPITNTQAYLLNEQQQPVPDGELGELYLGGAGVARGYLNRPKLTAERFIRNPFANNSSDRLYRTGDLVRRLSDGNLEYLGRIDHQVKIHGSYLASNGRTGPFVGAEPAPHSLR